MDASISLSYIQFKDKAPRLSSSGDLAIRDLKIVDRSSHPLLQLGLFHATWMQSRLLAGDIHLTKVELKSPEINIVKEIDVGISPTYVKIDKIALEDLDSRIIINANGSLNLQNIVTAEAEKSPTTSKPQRAQTELALKTTSPKDTGIVPVNIGRITCKNGKISFTDRSISPSYSAALVDIQGSPIVDLSPFLCSQFIVHNVWINCELASRLNSVVRLVILLGKCFKHSGHATSYGFMK